jgi:hypothetical protein
MAMLQRHASTSAGPIGAAQARKSMPQSAQ